VPALSGELPLGSDLGQAGVDLLIGQFGDRPVLPHGGVELLPRLAPGAVEEGIGGGKLDRWDGLVRMSRASSLMAAVVCSLASASTSSTVPLCPFRRVMGLSCSAGSVRALERNAKGARRNAKGATGSERLFSS
jgi:hypothetical protein